MNVRHFLLVLAEVAVLGSCIVQAVRGYGIGVLCLAASAYILNRVYQESRP